MNRITSLEGTIAVFMKAFDKRSSDAGRSKGDPKVPRIAFGLFALFFSLLPAPLVLASGSGNSEAQAPVVAVQEAGRNSDSGVLAPGVAGRDEDAAQIVWKPRVFGAPAGRVGGAVRGSRAPVTPLALAPERLGLTLQEAPSLFWHLDAAAPAEGRVIFTLVDERGEVPLVEAEIESPNRAGIQRIRLSDYGVELEPGPIHTWSVALVADIDHRDRDRISQGLVRRVQMPVPHPADATNFAAQGLWYDALEALSDRIDAEPDNAGIRARRRSLLDQAGIVIGSE